ncbi:glycosyltransferase [Synechococcus sp. HK01-R]|uniref:glycosyltransferase n=1 Tax=Synechococcus sp. HK01-R TaxID=2751171 RepID=UPI00162587F9|nr:glycosyltransferase [Synechococcus sp. HK01-R]QNG27779.1 glycosyltransferase [Synechococcus sp. HK01-R]
MTRPPLLLVVGMHRSGTSLLGGVLQRLGVALPGETIAGDDHNPEGYFEWDQVVATQERLLIDLERWWPSAQGTLALPAGWLEHPATLDARARLHGLLAAEVAAQEGPWAIKDPRCSRLLPLWLALCRELEIPLQIVLAVRDPAEVVASLVRRDGPLTGMDAYRAQQLWWRHNLEAIHTAREALLPLAVVDFARWFDQPAQQLQDLLAALPSLQPSGEQQRHALALIRPEHRRSLEAGQQLVLAPPLRRLYARLLRRPVTQRWPSAEPPGRLRRQAPPPLLPSWLEAHPAEWPAWLERHRHFPAPRCWRRFALGPDPVLNVCGPAWTALEPHCRLQRLPLLGLEQRRIDPARCLLHQLRLEPDPRPVATDAGPVELLASVALNLELPPPARAAEWLAHLRSRQVIWDPDPARVLLLRALALPAWWLDPEAPVNGWLQQPAANDPACWASHLGLAPSEKGALLVCGAAGAIWDRALAQEASQPRGQSAGPRIDYRPGWPELIIESPAAGLARAGWLQAAVLEAERLVVAGVQALPSDWQGLAVAAADPLLLPAEATPAELRALHRGEPLQALAEDRPSPATDSVFAWHSSRVPRASVLVSLFNYADRIEAALASVAVQTAADLELIVVDDASTDQGVETVRAWMQAQLDGPHQTFARLLLLRHTRNTGLAAARNTAFAAAQAPWCFVLDADNALFPAAVTQCLALAEAGAEPLAVVHPLLAVEAEPGRPDEQRTLASTASWQRQRLLGGNVVDAMALVRRSAWERVGGYTHIEGGWEDFDFWCKLVEAGFYGVQCPQLLAVYRSHAESMSHTATNRSWRALSRTLQARHPWLQLPLATP